MQGLFKRKGSDIWQGRFRIPERLWRARSRLVKLGVQDIGKAQEFARSTGKQDRDEAGRAYRAMLVRWDAKLDAWQALLDAGPQTLSHRQQVALAADFAKAFLAAHEDDPFEAPPGSPLSPPLEGDGGMLAMVEAMPAEARKAFAADLREFLAADDEGKRLALGFRLLNAYPGLRAILSADLTAALEAMHGADTDAALAGRDLHIDAESRRLLTLQMAHMMAAAERGLEARRGGDYRPVKELETAPAFASPVPKGDGGGLSLEALLDHKAKTGSIRSKTVSDNRSYFRKFAAFIGNDDARRVTKDDVRRWRDALIEAGLSPKTITDRYLSAVRAVLSHGVKEFDLPANVASGIVDNAFLRLLRAPRDILRSRRRRYSRPRSAAPLRLSRGRTRGRSSGCPGYWPIRDCG